MHSSLARIVLTLGTKHKPTTKTIQYASRKGVEVTYKKVDDSSIDMTYIHNGHDQNVDRWIIDTITMERTWVLTSVSSGVLGMCMGYTMNVLGL